MSVAIDCEMVASGNKSLLARVSIVDNRGVVLYDTYVRPTAPVTNYRTSISGITEGHLVNGRELQQVQREVCSLINGKILVGHSVHFDLEALGLSYSESNIRDLAKYEPFMMNDQPQSLKDLAKKKLGKTIQVGPHSSVEDAQTAMQLYNLVANNWK